MFEARNAELARLALRYLDCGRRDEYALDIGARVLAARMRDMGLDVRHEEFDDDHRNVGYRYEDLAAGTCRRLWRGNESNRRRSCVLRIFRARAAARAERARAGSVCGAYSRGGFTHL